MTAWCGRAGGRAQPPGAAGDHLRAFGDPARGGDLARGGRRCLCRPGAFACGLLGAGDGDNRVLLWRAYAAESAAISKNPCNQPQIAQLPEVIANIKRLRTELSDGHSLELAQGLDIDNPALRDCAKRGRGLGAPGA